MWVTALRCIGLCHHIHQKDFIKLTLGQFAAKIYKDYFDPFSLQPQVRLLPESVKAANLPQLYNRWLHIVACLKSSNHS